MHLSKTSTAVLLRVSSTKRICSARVFSFSSSTSKLQLVKQFTSRQATKWGTRTIAMTSSYSAGAKRRYMEVFGSCLRVLLPGFNQIPVDSERFRSSGPALSSIRRSFSVVRSTASCAL
eukprot:4022544-Amphidinium_carterae.1